MSPQEGTCRRRLGVGPVAIAHVRAGPPKRTGSVALRPHAPRIAGHDAGLRLRHQDRMAQAVADVGCSERDVGPHHAAQHAGPTLRVRKAQTTVESAAVAAVAPIVVIHLAQRSVGEVVARAQPLPLLLMLLLAEPLNGERLYGSLGQSMTDSTVPCAARLFLMTPGSPYCCRR